MHDRINNRHFFSRQLLEVGTCLLFSADKGGRKKYIMMLIVFQVGTKQIESHKK